MKRFKNLLVVLGDDNVDLTALSKATLIARENQAAMAIVQVIDSEHWHENPFGPQMELRNAAVEKRLEEVKALVTPFKPGEAEMPVSVIVGSPCTAVVSKVLQTGHDLVVSLIETREEQHHAQRLTRLCPCPVWGIKSANEGKYRHILACVDPDPGDPLRDGLNENILELAVGQARLEEAELHILHVYDLFMESVLIGSGKMQAYEIEEQIRAIEDMQDQRMSKLLVRADLKDVRHHIHLVRGRPRDLIARWAKEHDVDLIVMGSVCRTGVAGFFVGNTAESVLRHANCSLLTLKPEGFECPVKVEKDTSVYTLSDRVR